MTFSVDSGHFLAVDGRPVRRDIIAGGRPMAVRRAIVLHFTGGADGDGDTNGDLIKDAGSAAEVMRGRGVSAHLVVDRDGAIIQCRPFNLTAGHAGAPGMSRWRDPKGGQLYDGCNQCTIGIEMANAGDSEEAQAWARKHGATFAMAAHRNGGGRKLWEMYPAVQVQTVTAICKALVARYNLDDITGHDCVAPERKQDPGPLFPMEQVRAACGFAGLPAVHHL